MDSTRSIWNDAPAVRLLLPLITGIMGAVSLLHFVFQPLVFYPHYRFIVAYLMLSLALLCAVLLQLNRLASVVTGYRLRFVAGTVVQLQMFIIGWLLVFVHTSVFDRSHLIHVRSEECLYTARITEPPVRKEKTTMAVAELSNEVWRKTANCFRIGDAANANRFEQCESKLRFRTLISCTS
jgi:hypothetical protein